MSWDEKTKGEEEEEDKRKDKKQKKKQKKKSRKKRKRKPPSPYRLSHFVAPLYVAPSPTPGNAKPTSESEIVPGALPPGGRLGDFAPSGISVTRALPPGESGGAEPPSGISVARALPPQVDVQTVKSLKMSPKGRTDLKI